LFVEGLERLGFDQVFTGGGDGFSDIVGILAIIEYFGLWVLPPSAEINIL